jgi:bacillithiol biosynthesis deacetylase BshB1
MAFFDFSDENKSAIIRSIRRHQPEIVITNAVEDRHPDHGRASKLVSDCCFLSGLIKIEMEENGKPLTAWRPRQVYHMIQDHYHAPDICVDITAYIDKKDEAVLAFKSQFYDAESTEPNTPISGPDFQEFLRARARETGRLIGVEFAEGYTTERPVKKRKSIRIREVRTRNKEVKRETYSVLSVSSLRGTAGSSLRSTCEVNKKSNKTKLAYPIVNWILD